MTLRLSRARLIFALSGVLSLIILGGVPAARATSAIDNPESKLAAEAWLDVGYSLDLLAQKFFVVSPGGVSICKMMPEPCSSGIDKAVRALDSRWALRAPGERNAQGDRVLLGTPSFSIVEVADRFPSALSKSAIQAEQLRVRAEKRKRFERVRPAEADLEKLQSFFAEKARVNRLLVGAIVDGFINGFHHAMDPFAYVTPVALEQKLIALATVPEFYTGLRLSPEPAGWVVAFVDENSPASRAGLRQNDRILTVNGQALASLPSSSLDNFMKAGPSQWKVQRASETLSLSVAGELIDRPKFEARLLSWQGKWTAVLRLATFDGDETLCKAVSERIEELRRQKPVSSFVLDLRGNGGGRVVLAQCLSALFLGSDQLIATTREVSKDNGGYKFTDQTTEMRTYSAEQLRALKLKVDVTTPLVVLVDGDSASATELTTGALRDHNRAWVIGQRTWGKGTESDPYYWRLGKDIAWEFQTSAIFYQPNGTSNQLVGLLPDFVVPSRLNAPADEDAFLRNTEENPDALQKVNEASPPPRPEGIAKVKKCMDLGAVAAEVKRLQATPVAADYQLLFALEALRCTK